MLEELFDSTQSYEAAFLCNSRGVCHHNVRFFNVFMSCIVTLKMWRLRFFLIQNFQLVKWVSIYLEMGLFVKQDTYSTETLLSLSCRVPTFFTVAVHVGNYLHYFLFWAKISHSSLQLICQYLIFYVVGTFEIRRWIWVIALAPMCSYPRKSFHLWYSSRSRDPLKEQVKWFDSPLPVSLGVKQMINNFICTHSHPAASPMPLNREEPSRIKRLR